MKHRKPILFGASTVAALLLFVGAAFACTTFKGQLELTGNASSGTSVTKGANSGMQHCPGSPTGWAEMHDGHDGEVKVVVKPITATDATTDCPESKLAAGDYDVNYVNGAAFTGDLLTSYRNWLIDCMSPPDTTAGVINLGTITVDSTGNGGPVTFGDSDDDFDAGNPNTRDALTGEPVDESAVCVSKADGSTGNQGPISVVL